MKNLNNWKEILREIFLLLKKKLNLQKKITAQILGGETINFICDDIGEILFSTDTVSYIKYIEDIIEVNNSIIRFL